jgi:hypothetical protein
MSPNTHRLLIIHFIIILHRGIFLRNITDRVEDIIVIILVYDASGEVIAGIHCNNNVPVRVKMGQDKYRKKYLLEGVKSFFLVILPRKGNTFLSEEGQWLYDAGISTEEMVVKVGKMQKYMDIFEVTWGLPILDAVNFLLVHFYSFSSHN